MEMARAPKLLVLVCTAVIALILLVNRGSGNKSASLQSDALTMASLHLEDAYLLYFQPIETSAGEGEASSGASVDYLKKLTADYTAVIEHGLDGEVLQVYDLLLHGLAFRLEYTEKVYNAIGSAEASSNVAYTTDERLLAYLRSFRADEMAKNGVSLTLERDKTISTQE